MPIAQVVIMFVILVLISSIVGAVAKMLNNLAEANAARRAEEERRRRNDRAERAAERARQAQDERAERPARPQPTAPRSDDRPAAVRPATSDMDRFLAEIDRLRRKQAVTPDAPAAPGSSPPVAPVVQPVKPVVVDQPRRRVVAELADPPVVPPVSTGPSFGTSPQAPTRTAPVAGQVEQLPVVFAQRASSSTGAPATKVTRFANRPRPTARTDFGKNLTTLLGTGQGAAMAVVLQEILGPSKAKKNAGGS